MTTQSSVEPAQLLRKATWLAQCLRLTMQRSNRETNPPNVHKNVQERAANGQHDMPSCPRRMPGQL